MQPEPVAAQMAAHVQHVAPQPVSHRVAVSVDEQHAECPGCDGVDQSVLAHIERTEAQEERHGADDGQHMIGIGNKVVERYRRRGLMPDQRDGQDTSPRQQQAAQRCGCHLFLVVKQLVGMELQVSTDDVDSDIPAEILADAVAKECAKDAVECDQNSDETQVKTLVKNRQQLVDERSEQEQPHKCGCKASAHAVCDIEHRLVQLRQAECLIAAQAEDSEYQYLVELDLKVELQEFCPSESLLAHEVARDEQEAVDARLSTPAPQRQKQLIAADVAVVKMSGDTTVDHIMVGNNHEHQHDTEQLDVAVTHLLGWQDRAR